MKSDAELKMRHISGMFEHYNPDTYSLSIDEAVRACELNIEAFQARKARIEAMRPKKVLAAVMKCPGIGNCPRREDGCEFLVKEFMGKPDVEFIRKNRDCECGYSLDAIFELTRGEGEYREEDESKVLMVGV